MLIHRELLLYAPLTQVLTMLRNQLRTANPHGNVDDNGFLLFKSIAGYPPKAKVWFVFCGTIEKCNEFVRIKYTVRPSLLICLIAGLLLSITLFGVWKMILGTGSVLFLAVSVVFNAGFHLNLFSQINACISLFINKMKRQ